MAKKISYIDEKFNTIYSSYSSDIYRFCMSRLNCDIEASEDCLQETFLVLLERIRSGEKIDNPRAFLYRTAYNFVLQKYDSIKRQSHISLDAKEVQTIPSKDKAIDDIIDFSEFEKELDSLLDDNEKCLYIARFIDGKKIDEIAKELGISVASCTMRISRLKSKIKQRLIDYRI